MGKLIVDLPPPLETFINDLVAEGQYIDAGEVVRDAVRRFAEDSDPDYSAKLAALREALRPGIEDADAGRFSNKTIRQVAEESQARWIADNKK